MREKEESALVCTCTSPSGCFFFLRLASTFHSQGQRFHLLPLSTHHLDQRPIQAHQLHIWPHRAFRSLTQQRFHFCRLHLHLRGDRVRAMADALFPSPGPLRWAASRQHSPDLLLCRTADGATCWVLGELHVAMNTLESRLFRTQCDDPAELVESTARDMSRGRVVPVYPRHAAGAMRPRPPLPSSKRSAQPAASGSCST